MKNFLFISCVLSCLAIASYSEAAGRRSFNLIAPTPQVNEASPPIKSVAPKASCPCSPACTCGCQNGGQCTCNNPPIQGGSPIVVPVSPQPQIIQPFQMIPRSIPMFRGGGRSC